MSGAIGPLVASGMPSVKGLGRWLPLAGSLLGACLTHAAPPKLEALFPAGGQAGSSFVLSATGRMDPDARLWSATPEVFFVPTGKPREWQVTLTPQAPPGLHLVYAANAEGASEPRWFSIGTLPETREAEPNDEVGKGQLIEKPPVCINGRLEKSGDVDAFSVKLAAGQTVVALVEAYALGSPIDVMAHVLDDQGMRVATASDARNLDPVIIFTAPKPGTYSVQLAGFTHPPAADVRFTGGPAAVYRLHLTTAPVVTRVHPPSVATTVKNELAVHGYNLDPRKPRQIIEPSQIHLRGDTAWITPAGAPTPLQVLAAAQPAELEKEPNNTREQATEVRPGVVGGEIGAGNDIDRFAIAMKKGDRMEARVWSKRLGLPLDAMVKIEGPDGKALATADDQSEQQPDPVAQWTAAADGLHQIIVTDLFQQGGPDMGYVLETGPPRPGFEARVADGKPLVLEAGKSATIGVQVKLLNAFQEALVVRAAGLPPGVHAIEVPVPEKGGNVDLKLQAAANAPAGGHLISIEVWTRSNPPRMQPATYGLRGEALRGTTLLDDAANLWLTVKRGK